MNSGRGVATTQGFGACGPGQLHTRGRQRFVSDIRPLVNEPVQEFVPEYVPLIAVSVTPTAVPFAVIEQFGSPTTAPRGTTAASINVVPVTVPDTVPLNPSAVNVPEMPFPF